MSTNMKQVKQNPRNCNSSQFYEIQLSVSNAHRVMLIEMLCQPYGGRLNKKDGLTRYGDSHVKDKTS